MTAALSLYNTLTRSLEPFRPEDPSRVRLYVCGPTVYDYAHIGNARPVVVFDVLFRLLRAIYGAEAVTYVRNVTDVEDKIIARAAQSGESIGDLTRRTEAQYCDDMAALGALDPSLTPRATDHIAEMIGLIATLIERDHAYAAEGHVLFHVPSMPTYGRLSGKPRDEQIAGARVEVAAYKRDPADFILWKPAAPEEPGWDSPWGRGRPGWHIECSAMAGKHLGPTFDIHGGGQDLIFPHHENEIAQSCCAHGTDRMASVWMHNGYVLVDGEKMSKSAGNFTTVHDLLAEGWDGEAIRLVLLSGHYRAPLDFTRDRLRDAVSQLDRLYGALALVDDDGRPPANRAALLAPLLDDLNTPEALAFLHARAADIYRATDAAKQSAAAAAMRALGATLGLLERDPTAWLHRGDGDETAAIEAAIADRRAAKQAKNFAEADRIRDTLADRGIALLDRPDGTTEWRRA